MTRSLLLICFLLIAFTALTGSAAWPPPEIRGAWHVVSTSEDDKPDVLNSERTLLLEGNQFVLIEVDCEFGLPPFAHSWDLSEGRSDGARLEVLFHTPSVTVQRDGTKKSGVSKEPITLLIEQRDTGRLLSVEWAESEMNLTAKRVDQTLVKKRIGLHLENPDFDCSLRLRKLLKRYTALNDQSKSDEP